MLFFTILTDPRKNPENKGPRPRFYFLLVASLFLYELISGMIIWLGKDFSAFYQFNLLFHIFAGFLFFLPFTLFQFIHYRRATAGWRGGYRLTGYLSYGVVAAVGLTGLHLTVVGIRKEASWIPDVHLWAGLFGALFVFLHGFLRMFRGGKSFLPTPGFSGTPALGMTPAKGLLWISGMTAAIFSVQGLLAAMYKEPGFPGGIPASCSLRYGDNPFYPSEAMTESGGLVDAGRIGNSRSCAAGGCHKDIYYQWQASAHRYSSTDVFYRKAEEYFIETDGKESTRYCAGCHDPVALFSGGVNPGEGLDTPYSDEGSSCILCHGISRIRHLKGSGSYVFNPPRDYLFAHSEGNWAGMLNRLLIRTAPALHRAEYSRDFYSTPEYCAVCHKQYIQDPNNWGWVKLQDQYGEWLASPFSGRNDKGFHKDTVKMCRDCHMPLVPSRDPAAGKDGMVRSHRFIAANTAVPWLDGDEEQYAMTKEWLKGRKLLVDIFIPRDKEGTRSQAFVDTEIYGLAEPGLYVSLGQEVSLNVAVTNALVGHDFPNGPLDIYESWLELKVVDGQNNVIYHSGGLDEDGYVMPGKTRFFFTLGLSRKGTLIDKHNLWHMIGHAYKKTIPAGQTDISIHTFRVPYWAKGDITVTARVRYRRFNQWYTDWVFGDREVRLPIIDMGRDTLSVPIRNQPQKEKF